MAHADINICCELLRMCFFLQMARVSRRIKTPPNPQGISLEKNLIFFSTLIHHKKNEIRYFDRRFDRRCW